MLSSFLHEKEIFTKQQLQELGKAPLPRHIAIIMDGNRRWARQKAPLAIKDVFSGHWRGAEVVDHLVDSALHLGIEQLTLFAFSTENWSRSPFEIEQLMCVLSTFLKDKRQKMSRCSVRFETIGDLSPFSKKIQNDLKETKELTSSGQALTLVLALNYGGRSEICRAAKQFAQEVMDGKVQLDQLDESLFKGYLDTSDLPFSDPDLLIRTSGEMRISNFLLWQLAYTEVYVTETLWPDFSSEDLFLAIKEYQSRERRLGK
jgi:undecaprenyl diphosphate synthase